jgi:biopolymer transport protein ExbB
MVFLQAAATTTIQLTRSESVIDIIMKGGWILIPILLMSIVAVFLIIEKLTQLSSVSKIDQSVVNEICKRIREKDYVGARDKAQAYHHPIGRIVAAGLENPKRSVKDIEQTMGDEAKAEVFIIEKNISWIGTIASIAPMFGFLGTIFGVIKIFYNISLADNISIGIIAGGLYQKMVSSAAGLTVGILAYAGFFYLNTLVDKHVHKMEKPLNQVINTIKDNQ